MLPPFRSRIMLAWAPAWDKYGTKSLAYLAGVTVTEASKQVFATHALPARAARRRGFVPSMSRPGARCGPVD